MGRIEKRIEKQNSQLIEEIHSDFPQKWEESGKRIEKQNSQLIEEIHSVFSKMEESRNLLQKNMGRIKKDKS